MKKLALILCLSVVFAVSAKAQDHDHNHEQHRTCGTVDYNTHLKESDAQIKQSMENVERDIQNWLAANPQSLSNKSIVTIPVVVHVVYKTNYQNISDAQIQSQIDVLNEDYRRTNADASNTPNEFLSVAADCEIQFCLAQFDQGGNQTNGITRTQTTKSGFDINSNEAKYSSMGGKDAWDRNRYLNIWVVPAITDNGMSGILGYAQLPGGPSATDGVVIQHENFGTTGTSDYPYDKGRTATHEVGHWLSLYHIWGDDGNACWGSDQCDDTPNQGSENYSCPTYPSSSCSNNSDMFMNFMDYTDDACMNLFTKDQKARMWAVLNGTRSSLKTSTACGPVDILNNNRNTPELKVYPNPGNGLFNLEISSLNQTENIRIRAYSSTGREVFNTETAVSEGARVEIQLPDVPSGLYQLSIETSKGLISRKIMIQ